jgi:uncharacterized RDD family membrane protein YckC
MKEPASVSWAVVENLVALMRGRVGLDLTGVSGLGGELAKAGRGPRGLWFFALFTSYLWPGVWLVQGGMEIDAWRGSRFTKELPSAKLAVRFFAFAVDAVLLAVAFGVGALVGTGLGASPAAVTLCSYANALVVLAVQWALLGWTGQTIGKRWFRLRVVLCDGSPAGFVRTVALRSWLFGALAFVPSLGALPFLADPLLVFRRDRRCLHDLVAGTKVVLDELPLSGAQGSTQ